jgi:DNA-binding response OmpR family regulator
MTLILIVDDDDEVSSLLEKGLSRAGYATMTVATGVAAIEATRGVEVALVLLDVGLPDVDGVTAMAMMRAVDPAIPVLLVTGRDESRDIVRGLESGADDYITKPFRFDELLARVRSRLRISAGGAQTILQHGRVALDLLARTATVDGREVELSAREFALAEEFLRHPGQVLQRDQLLQRVWGYTFDPGSNVVDVYVGYLRRKLGPDVIDTLRGIGYRLGRGEGATP